MLGTFPHYLYQSLCTKGYLLSTGATQRTKASTALLATRGCQGTAARALSEPILFRPPCWFAADLAAYRTATGQAPRKTGNLKAAAMPVSANSRNRRSLSQACKNFILIFLAQALQKASHVWACLCNPCAVMEQAGLSASKPQHNHAAFANARISAGKVPFQSFFLLVGVVLAMCKQNRCPAAAYA